MVSTESIFERKEAEIDVCAYRILCWGGDWGAAMLRELLVRCTVTGAVAAEGVVKELKTKA